MKKLRPLSLPAIWNMSFGFLGIQFGFGLQLANMSAIYAKLGADAAHIPLLWLAGPMTGLIVQPIIGAMSSMGAPSRNTSTPKSKPACKRDIRVPMTSMATDRKASARWTER